MRSGVRLGTSCAPTLAHSPRECIILLHVAGGVVPNLAMVGHKRAIDQTIDCALARCEVGACPLSIILDNLTPSIVRA